MKINNNQPRIMKSMIKSEGKVQSDTTTKDQVSIGSAPEEKKSINLLPDWMKNPGSGTDPSFAIATTPMGALVGAVKGGFFGTMGWLGSLMGPVGVGVAVVASGGIGFAMGMDGTQGNVFDGVTTAVEHGSEALLGSHGSIGKAVGVGATVGAARGLIGGLTFNN